MIAVSPFVTGQLAFTAGQKPATNPHILHSKDWVRWNSGWVSAQLAAQKAARQAQLAAINNRPLPDWVGMQEAESK